MSRVNRFTVSCLIGVVIAMTSGLADAQPRQPADGPAVMSGGLIYGGQLMTPAERNEFRTRMLAATSDAEREKIRAEHHAEMQKRAKERGIKLPDVPPMRGMHRGQGMGMGMGQGGYMRGQPGGPASGAAAQ